MRRWPIGLWKKDCGLGRILGLRWRNDSGFQKRFNFEPACLAESDHAVRVDARDEYIVTGTMIVIASPPGIRLSQCIGFGVRSAARRFRCCPATGCLTGPWWGAAWKLSSINRRRTGQVPILRRTRSKQGACAERGSDFRAEWQPSKTPLACGSQRSPTRPAHCGNRCVWPRGAWRASFTIWRKHTSIRC